MKGRTRAMEKLKAGIIGLGLLGNQYLEFFRTRKDVEVVGVCDVRRSIAETAAAKYHIDAYSEVNELLKAHRPDLVVVATPDHLHLAPTLAAIEAGTPAIILEKPLATTLDEANMIFEKVEQSGAKLLINYANRAMPYDLATYYVLKNQLIGQPIYAESRLDDNISVPTRLWGERSREFAAGSSPAHFLLSHVVDLMHWYFAPAHVVDVFAISQERVLGFTSDLFDAFLTFDNGLKVRVKAEWIKHMDQIVEYYTCITGERGSIIYNKRPGFGVQESWRANLSAPPSDSVLQEHHQRLGEQGIDTRLAYHYRPITTAYDASTVRASLEHIGPDQATGMMLIGPMLDAITEDTLTPSSWRNCGPLPTHWDGLRQVQVVQAIVDSAYRNAPVAVKQ
ncbi:MAG: Gfo/Idh/MocA family oxidoreductase [Candidatus Caldarchaeum sp.]